MYRSLLTLVTLAASCAANAQMLYSTDFSTETEFKKWTVVDANNDGETWKFDAEGSQSKVYYSYSASNAANDWLISPAITPTKDGRMMVAYTTYGTSYGESMGVYTGSAPTVEAMTGKQAEYDKIPGARTSDYITVDVKKGEPVYVGFHATSPADHWRFYMCAFKAQMVEKLVDLKVDSLLSPATAMGLTDRETVKVRVTNDGKEDAAGFELAYQIDDQAPVKEAVDATLKPGESMVYTFRTPADLSTPLKQYTLKAYSISEYDILNDNDTLTAVVRHRAPLTPPYKMGFESNEMTDDFKYYNLNSDDGDWEVYRSSWMNMARTGYGCLAYNYNKQNDADDWAILDPIQVEAGDYVLRYWYSGTDGHTEKLGVYYGNGDTPADMTHLIDRQDAITQGLYQESFKIVHFDEPQVIYLGFYAYSKKDENWLSVDDVQFYKASSNSVDLVVSNLTRPYDYVREPNNKDVTLEVSNVGIKDASGTLTFNIDDKDVKTMNVDLKAQAIKTVNAGSVLSSLSAGKHKLTVTLDSPDDENIDNNVLEKEFVVLPQPQMLYDFEDGKIPSDLTFYTGDAGTVNPDAGEEFNADGWGIIDVESHRMYGNHVLGGTSWLNGASAADRWVILPQITVNDADSYFVWDASSGNPVYLENYKVKVSDGSGNPADYWYSTELEVKGETVEPKTRGISLAKYVGKDIYIAINLTSPICDFLALDNLGVYGKTVATGISDLTQAPAANVLVSADELAVAGAKAIRIVDLSGRTVMTVSGQKAAISNLLPGVYVGVARTAAGQQTVKFVKK